MIKTTFFDRTTPLNQYHTFHHLSGKSLEQPKQDEKTAQLNKNMKPGISYLKNKNITSYRNNHN